MTRSAKIDSFRFRPGEVLADRYEVLEKLGKGWEGEVYLLSEQSTGIERAGKFFFPHRNPNNRSLRAHARRLHNLRHCSMVTQYHARESLVYRGKPVAFMVSEFVEGERLSQFIARQPGKRLDPFQAIHLLHALTVGVEEIHEAGEYHGDLHDDNIIIHCHGLSFGLKLLDFFDWGPRKGETLRYDVHSLIRLLYDVLGGKKHYAKQPPAIKTIVCGLKTSLINKRFRSVSHLRRHLENMSWS